MIESEISDHFLGLWPVKDVIAENEKKLFCRKHRRIDHFPAGSCGGGGVGTCTHVQGQTRCQKKCLEDKDCVGINYSKEFGNEGRCDVCNECDGAVCEGNELQTWPKGGRDYYPIHGIEISAVDFFIVERKIIYIL